MNGSPASEPQHGVVLINQEPAERALLQLADPAGEWLCGFCQNRVAFEQDRFPFNGQDEFTFTNPDGVRFNIITFGETCGCSQAGKPSLVHTWFADHAWNYCLCADCGQHLGWYFQGEHQFAGLIKDRLIRAIWLRN